jgi:hypothetical protein
VTSHQHSPRRSDPHVYGCVYLQVEPINPRDLQGFCAQAGFDSRVVDRSAVTLGLFQPPQQTVDVTDWERASALRYVPHSRSTSAHQRAQRLKHELARRLDRPIRSHCCPAPGSTVIICITLILGSLTC